VIQLLARGLPRLHRAVHDLRPLGHVHLGRVVLQGVAARGRDRARDHEQPRPRDVALVDGLLDADVAVARAFRLHVAQGREPLLQGAAGGHRGPRGAEGEGLLEELGVVAALRRVLALQEEVRVGVDEAGEDGRGGKVDHGRALRRRSRGGVAHGFDAMAAHEDELIAARRERPAVEQTAGADDDEGIGGIRRRHEGRRQRNGDGRCCGRRLESLRHGQTRAGVPATGPT
jgi:hypothetical protein